MPSELPGASDPKKRWVVNEIHGYWDEEEPDPTVCTIWGQRKFGEGGQHNPMPKYCVKLKGTPKIIPIEAESMEEVPNLLGDLGSKSGELCAKDASGKVIAKFDLSSVAGWWPDQEKSISIAKELEEARKRVEEREKTRKTSI